MGLFRLLLAISIVIAHSSPIFGLNLIGGRVAVESFFLLSGFYMALVLTDKYQGNLHAFYKNRFLKIFPQYWLFLFLCLLVGLITQAGIKAFLDFQLNPISKIIIFFFNLSPVFQDITNYLAYNPQSHSLFFTATFRSFKPEIWNFLIMPQTWVISLELLFYMIAPRLNRQKTKLLLVVCFLSLAIRLLIYLSFHLNFDPWEYRFFPNELIYFVSGILAYRLYQTLEYKTKYIFLLPLFIFFFFYQYIPHQTLKMIGYYLLTFLTIPFLFSFTKSSKFDRLLGDISYPLFLSHFLLINILTQIFHLDHHLLGLATLIICLPLSYLTYIIFQKRIDLHRTN